MWLRIVSNEKRSENIFIMKDFAAIDFETANECRSSVCSVGVVIVREGNIVDSFYSLIHPEPEYYQWFCQQVHGLTEEDTEDAPVFPVGTPASFSLPCQGLCSLQKSTNPENVHHP